jgi:outer membrane protein
MIDFVKKKVTSMLLAGLVLLGAAGLAAALPNQAHAATAPIVGVVDIGLLVNQHPDTPKANETIKTEAQAAEKEFDGKAAGLGDKEKQDLRAQLLQRVGQKQQELFKGIADKIDAAVKEVAKAKGLTVVVQKSSIVYGGLDITEDVLKKLQ